MVVDTSVIVAILFGEFDAPLFEQSLAGVKTRLLSAVTRAEVACVVEGRKGHAGRLDLERLLSAGDFEVVGVTPEHAEIAFEAFRRFGKGRHPAGRNIGDCFSYALATSTGHALLFKGNDFGNTDIRGALTPRRNGPSLVQGQSPWPCLRAMPQLDHYAVRP
jgi:ribonuclease VapC